MPLIIKIMIYLPGTFLHEFSHYIAALILGTPAGFTILPRIEGNTVVLGRVTASVRFKVLSVFIAAAPLIWWIASVFLLEHLKIFNVTGTIPDSHISLFADSFKWVSFRNIFYVWLFVQLLLAGRLSIRDIKTLLGGILSVSGIVTIFFLFFGYQVIRFYI